MNILSYLLTLYLVLPAYLITTWNVFTVCNQRPLITNRSQVSLRFDVCFHMANYSEADLLALVRQLSDKYDSTIKFEHDTFKKLLMEKVTESVSNTLKDVTTSLAERQDSLEQKTIKRITSLSNQISSLKSRLQCTNNQRSLDVSMAVQSLISCGLCSESFDTLTNLDIHIRGYHPELQCKFCDRTLRSKPDFNYHQNKYHNIAEHDKTSSESCIPCGETLPNQPALTSHQDSLHDQYFAHTSGSSDTLQDFHIKCVECAVTFISKEELEVHVRNEHAHYQAVPSLTEQPLQQFSPRHSPGRLQGFTCNFCTSSYSHIEDLNTHISTYHVPTYPCYACNLMFTSQEHLKLHVSCHDMQAVHACFV